MVYVGFIIQQKDVSVKRKSKKTSNKGCDKCANAPAVQLSYRKKKNLHKGLTERRKSGKVNRHSTRRNASVHKERCPSGLRKQS